MCAPESDIIPHVASARPVFSHFVPWFGALGPLLPAGTGSGDTTPLPSSPPLETHSQKPYDFTYMWSLGKNKTNEQTNQNKNRLLETEGEASERTGRNR